MKKITKPLFIMGVLLLSVSSLSAETIIGKVYGKKTWIAYIGSGHNL